MEEKAMTLFFIVSLLAVLFIAGCTSSNTGVNSTPGKILEKNVSGQSTGNTSATTNASVHVLTPEMKSRAIAITLNSSFIRQYRDNQVGFEITSVVLPEKPYISFVGKTMHERYFPIVSVTTATENLTMYIDLENGETHAVDRVYTHSDFSNDPEILAILASSSTNDRLTDEQMTNDTFLESFQPTCQKIIEALRRKNATHDQISALLELNGYYWVPGDFNQSCGTGYAPSAESRELWAAVRGPDYHPFGNSS